MLKIQNVTKVYSPDVIALQDVSFDIREGEFVLIVGRSGAGKTTLLKLIIAEEKPTKGRIIFRGKDVHRLSGKELPNLRRKLGAVFQDYKLLPAKTVYENVSFVLRAIGAADEEIEKNVPKVLDIVGLDGKKDKFPRELSSGEKQRVSIARALIHRPDIILADEPTGNLDPANTSEIIDLLKKIHSLGSTIILATHDRDIIKHLKTRTVLFKQARLEMDSQDGKVLL